MTTDKQIIIDGVDVSGCPYYIDSDGSCSSHDCECVKCVHNVCFYKDYKAKEQECEGLKKDLDFQKNMYECARADEEDKFEEILELKQTLTEIKEIAERCGKRIPLFEIDEIAEDLKQIYQKISECEGMEND